MREILCVVLGLTAGTLSGMLGIGGGIIIIPALVYFFGLTQHQAQGTTLALMTAPIGLLAALRYYHNGNVKLGIAGLVCLGFFFGALIGANVVQSISEPMLKKLFGVLLFLMSIRMIFFK